MHTKLTLRILVDTNVVLDGLLNREPHVVGFVDYEDAVLHEAARQVLAQGIVTRNPRHFKPAALPVYTPEELSRALDLRESELP
jgi:hypothetical protein